MLFNSNGMKFNKKIISKIYCSKKLKNLNCNKSYKLITNVIYEFVFIPY